MPPADNTPDFDNMTPEQITAWMESLAERQGAVEGFTTNERMEVAEIDPSTVDVEDNYIPSNWRGTKEEWQQKVAQERAEREAQRAAMRAASPPASPPPTPAPPPAPTPEPEPAPASAPMGEGGMPDFDNMTPEQITAWMESLAERQGAVEGFTTNERMEVAEIDPTTVDIEDNYVPSNWRGTKEEWQQKVAQERAEREAQKAAQQQQAAAPPPAATPPAPEPLIEQPAATQEPALPRFELPQFDFDDQDAVTESSGLEWLEGLAANQGDFPEMDLSGLGEELEGLDFGDLQQDTQSDPLEWLQGLSGQDNSGFGFPSDTAPQPQNTASITPPPSNFQTPVSDPTESNVDPLEWLESLADRQGASSDELITGGGVNVPDADSAQPDTRYTDYTVEAPEMDNVGFSTGSVDSLDQPQSDDPVAWLEQLAESQGTGGSGDASALFTLDDEGDDDETEVMPTPPAPVEETQEDIIARLNKAEDVSPADMENWMSNLLERGAARDDVEDYIDTDDEESEEIAPNIPDWLLEQAGDNIPVDLTGTQQSREDTSGLEGLFDDTAQAQPNQEVPDWLQDAAPAAAADVPSIPDWLNDDGAEEEQPEDIFSPESDQLPSTDVRSTDEFVINTSDPWVEAFELERKEGAADTSKIPDWYKERLGQIGGGSAGAALAEAAFEAEMNLAEGEPEAVPAWMSGEAELASPFTQIVEESEPVPADVSWLVEEETVIDDEDMPDWLRDHDPATQEAATIQTEEMPDWLSGVDNVDEVPDWLRATSTDMQPQTVFTTDEPPGQAQTTPAFVPQQPAQPAAQPAASSPAPVPMTNIDVDATLQSARDKLTRGDAESALHDYEAIVRANTRLDEVVNDLSTQIKGGHKHTAGVYRVLGDGLMRQGRLQEALDTYRRALNLL